MEALEKDLKASALMHSTLEGTFNQQRHHWEAQVSVHCVASVPLTTPLVSMLTSATDL